MLASLAPLCAWDFLLYSVSRLYNQSHIYYWEHAISTRPKRCEPHTVLKICIKWTRDETEEKNNNNKLNHAILLYVKLFLILFFSSRFHASI